MHKNHKIDVLYVDNHLLAVNKPAGVLTHATDLDSSCMQEQAKAWVKEIYHKPGNVFLEAIHRIDKPVSGIVVFARTSKALSRLTKSVRERLCHKKYLAVVEGALEKEGLFEDFLIHGDYRAICVSKDHKEGKIARLKYRVIGEIQGLSLVEVQLETGRYHQIRIQMASRGYPIVGDFKYGSKDSYRPNAIALHHIEFSIPHPVLHKELKITAPLPADWPWN